MANSRYGFSFDSNKCTGCNACQLSCAIENELNYETQWRQVNTFNPLHLEGLPVFHLSLACNHCKEPVCLQNCPANAYEQDPVTGVVTIDEKKCIGCKYCSWVCPYDAPQFMEDKGIMSKCTLCEQRLEEGLKPACVALCPTEALGFEKYRNRIPDNLMHGFSDTDIEPTIKIKPLRLGAVLPQQDNSNPLVAMAQEIFQEQPKKWTNKINIRHEWTLLVLTLLTAVLTGIIGAVVNRQITFPPLLFLVLATGGAGLSVSHLGRKERLFRSVLHVKSSWLSREIVSYGLFVGLSAISLLFPDLPRIFGIAAFASGLLCLYAMDKIYDKITALDYFQLHSARVLWSGVLFYFLFMDMYAMLISGLAVKFVFYGMRQISNYQRRILPHLAVLLARVCFGFVIPVILILSQQNPQFKDLFTFIFIGELIDRVEFYLGLNIISPKQQMDVDFEEELEKLKGRD